MSGELIPVPPSPAEPLYLLAIREVLNCTRQVSL